MKKNFVLLIDDDPDIVILAKFILEDAGYFVETSTTVEEGLIVLEKKVPDLIILDLYLPKMQGWELSKRLKGDNRFKTIPIIIFTANAGINIKTVTEMGGNDFIIKPYEGSELLEKVKSNLSKD